jgi:hypothetical protein
MPAAGIGFSEAVQALHAERRRVLRSHPSLAELEAYHRSRLGADAREQIAEHLSYCEDCTILLLFGVVGQEHPGEPPEFPASKVDEAWNRLRSRLEAFDEPRPTLAGRLRERPPSPEEAIGVALGVARALALLHARGLVLANLRSETVTIRPSGEIQLLDFALAPTAESFEVGYGRSAEDEVLDLYRALSPEQVTREALTPKSDLFSLGVLLYEMLTGISPFRDTTPLATASRILSLDPVPVGEIDPAIDPELSMLVDRLLAKEAAERPADAATVARELERCIGGSRSAPGASTASSVEDEIERLYDEIVSLIRDRSAEAASPALERAYARLIELQTAEAEQFRQRFEQSLEMPIDAGERILARARELREELEDLATSDAAVRNAHNP